MFFSIRIKFKVFFFLFLQAASSTQTDSGEVNRQNFYEKVNVDKYGIMNALIKEIGQPDKSEVTIVQLNDKNGKDFIRFRWLQRQKYHNLEKKVMVLNNSNAGESNIRIEYSTGQKFEFEIENKEKLQDLLLRVGIYTGEEFLGKIE